MSSEQKDVLYQQYLGHQKGMALLWLWMEQWSELEGWAWSEEQSTLLISPLASQRFVLGVPTTTRGVRGRSVFVGVQQDEAAWVRRMQWKRVVWDASQNTLWLVAKKIQSPDVAWPDLPSVAIGIHVDAEKLEQWQGPHLEWRGIWWDEDNRFHVDKAAQNKWSVKMGTLVDHWPDQDKQGLRSLRDVINDQLDSTNVWVNPGYMGEAVALSAEQEKMVVPYHRAPSDRSPIEERYPQLFGQFLETPPKSE